MLSRDQRIFYVKCATRILLKRLETKPHLCRSIQSIASRNLCEKLDDDFGRLGLSCSTLARNDDGLISNLTGDVMVLEHHDGVFVLQMRRRHGTVRRIHERRVGAIDNLKEMRWFLCRPTTAAVQVDFAFAVD